MNGRLSISGWQCFFLFLVSEEFFFFLISKTLESVEIYLMILYIYWDDYISMIIYTLENFQVFKHLWIFIFSAF